MESKDIVIFSGGSVDLSQVPINTPVGMSEERARQLLRSTRLGRSIIHEPEPANFAGSAGTTKFPVGTKVKDSSGKTGTVTDHSKGGMIIHVKHDDGTTDKHHHSTLSADFGGPGSGRHKGESAQRLSQKARGVLESGGPPGSKPTKADYIASAKAHETAAAAHTAEAKAAKAAGDSYGAKLSMQKAASHTAVARKHKALAAGA